MAWKSAVARTDKRAEAEAEVSSHRQTLPPTEAQALRSSWEKCWWRFQERQVPSKSLFQRVQEQLELSEVKGLKFEMSIFAEEDNSDEMALSHP